MSIDVNIQVLSNDEVKQLLDDHQLFRETDGRLGQWADLSYCSISKFDFSHANLDDVAAVGSRFAHCKFIQTQWTAANFEAIEAIDCDFSGAILTRLECYQSKLTHCDFSNANLDRAEFIESDLQQLNLSNCSVKGIVLSDNKLIETSFGTE